jgi:hypothetical protein
VDQANNTIRSTQARQTLLVATMAQDAVGVVEASPRMCQVWPRGNSYGPHHTSAFGWGLLEGTVSEHVRIMSQSEEFDGTGHPFEHVSWTDPYWSHVIYITYE